MGKQFDYKSLPDLSNIDVFVTIAFDMGISSLIHLKNPPTIPQHGQLFQCEWKSFIKSKEDLKAIDEFLETDVFKLERWSYELAVDGIYIFCILHDSEGFDKYIK